jgi:hypothetical protein
VPGDHSSLYPEVWRGPATTVWVLEGRISDAEMIKEITYIMQKIDQGGTVAQEYGVIALAIGYCRCSYHTPYLYLHVHLFKATLLLIRTIFVPVRLRPSTPCGQYIIFSTLSRRI